MENSIEELLNRPIPEKLWHYTSFQGFQGITESKRIFATDIRFLNDREEVVHVRKIADQLIQEMPAETANHFPAKEYLQRTFEMPFNEGALHPNRLQLFVACFSAAKDRLSQWRGYSQGSSGVSLAFNLTGVRPPLGLDTFVSFAPCVYDLNEKKRLLKSALNHFLKEAEEYWDGVIAASKKTDPLLRVKDNAAWLDEILKRNPKELNLSSRLREAMLKTISDLLRLVALL